MSRVLRYFLPVLFALGVALQVQRSAHLMLAQHLDFSVERRTLAMLRAGAIDKSKLRGNLEALADARRLDWAEVTTPTLQGGQHMMLGELEPARSAYHSALQLEPRPEILVNLGKVCYTQGARKRAVRYFAQAVLLDPRLLQEVPKEIRGEVSYALRSQDDADGADEN